MKWGLGVAFVCCTLAVPAEVAADVPDARTESEAPAPASDPVPAGGRIALEAVGGELVGAMGLAVGALAGLMAGGCERQTRSEGEDGRNCESVAFFFGTWTGVSLGVASGVYAVGEASLDGSFGATLLGAGLLSVPGVLSLGATIGDGDPTVAIVLLGTLPVAGAIVGFELTAIPETSDESSIVVGPMLGRPGIQVSGRF